MLAHLILVLTLATAGSGRAPGERPEAWRVLMWVLLLIIAFVVMFWLAIWFRRQFVGATRGTVHEAVGFSIADLRRMREEGRISQQEYELTRERLVHSARVAMAQSAEDDRVPADAPLTKDVDLIREAER